MDDDHDKLIEIGVKLDELMKQFSNHLSHHSRYTYLLIATTLGALVTTILTILIK